MEKYGTARQDTDDSEEKITEKWGDHRIQQKEVMEMAIRMLLQMQEADFYRDRKFNLVFRLDKYIIVLGIMLKSKDTSVKK